MDPKKADEIITQLVERNLSGHGDNNYLIDFSPFDYPNEDYSELAEYLEAHYKRSFAEKIKFIAFNIIYCYKSYIFLDNTAEDPIYPELVDKDLRNIGLGNLASLIDKIIIENWSHINILFSVDDTFALLRIEDGFDSVIFNLPDKEKEKIKSLIDHQGLFLKKIDN